MKKFNFSKAIIPNTFTALNLFCGFASIIYASYDDFIVSAVLIIIAGFFDLIDGLVARLLNSTSEFGVQLDSLSDVVSFGAAPSVLIYHAYLNQFDFLGIVISSFLLVFGCFRLARFNVQIEDLSQKADFRGLPIPVSAITISTFIIMFYPSGKPEGYLLHLIIPLILLLAFLMVSNIPYSAFPKLNSKTIKERPGLIVFVVFALIVLVLVKFYGPFLIFISIVLFGIFRSIFSKIFIGSNEQNIEVKNESNT